MDMMIKDCRVRNLFKVLDAKIKITLFDNETQEIIFNGYPYQVYDDTEKQKYFDDVYIEDMSIDYDGVRVLCYDKWKK